MSPYDELLRFAEREAGLIEAGEWDQLVATQAERRELLASLPPTPPTSARGRLERILALLERNASAIGAAMAQTRGELDRAVRARKNLGSYSAPTAPQLDFRR